MPRFRGGPALAAGTLCLVAVAAMALAPVAGAQDSPPAASAAPPTQFDIPAQSLATALTQFASQSRQELFYLPQMAEGKTTAGVSGAMNKEQALAALLVGSGLEFERAPNGAMLVGDRQALTTLRAEIEARQAASGNAEVAATTTPGVDGGTTATDSATETVTSQKRGGIEEIIVTARKREESIQDVPISITALSAEDMKTMGIKNVGDMEGIVVGLNMSGGGNGLKKDSNPYIRGIGQRETKVTLDPGVGSYLDGIYLARTAGALLDTVGMESIEILRGPQGTLFGKNVAGGAISFNTIKPKPGFSGSVTANIGNYGRGDLLAVANIPLIDDTLFTRFTLSSKKSDGTFTNAVDGRNWGDDNRITGIGQVRWLAGDSVTVDVLTERTRIRETPRPSKCTVVRPVDLSGTASPYWNVGNFMREGDSTNGAILRDAQGNALTYTVKTPISNYNPHRFNPLPVTNMDNSRTGNGNPNQRKTFQQRCLDAEQLPDDQFLSDMADGVLERNNDMFDAGRYWIDTKTVGVTPTWEIGDLGPLKNVQLKSISAWRGVNQIADEDLDATDFSQMIRVQDGFNETSQISQELQFTGSAFGDRLFFSTGLFYFHEETPQDILIRMAGVEQANPITQGPLVGVIAVNAIEPTRETLETDNEAKAWYGQLDFKLTPQIELTAGLRFTTEERWTAYTKAYAMSPSMLSGSCVLTTSGGVSSCGTDHSIANVNAPRYGLADVFDWRFYSAEFTGFGPIGWDDLSDCNLPQLPEYVDDDQFFAQMCRMAGYNGTLQGFPYGRKEKSFKNDAWTPMASLKYHAGETMLGVLGLDDAMAYFTYSKGFTSGGVTAGAVDLDPRVGVIGYVRIEDPVIYQPQYVDNYELGLKLQAMDRRVQANMAIFYNDFTDMQITSVAHRAGVPIPYVDNVGKAVIQGFEGELMLAPLRDWRIVLNTSYTDADLKVWDARNIRLDPFTGRPISEAYSVLDRSDEPMPRVPEWQAYLMTEYSFRLPAGGVLTPVIAARYTSEIYHGFDRGSYCYTYGGCDIGNLQVENPQFSRVLPGQEHAVTSEEVVFLDARLTYISGDGKVEIAAWGKNLTDKRDYLVGAIPLVDVTGTVAQVFADPRTFGLTMTYNFGAQ